MTVLLTILTVAAIIYAYAGFPILVFVRSLVCRRRWRKEDRDLTVDVVIICYNESECIREKLQNLLDVDYPKSCLRITVGSDGSDDGTDEIVDSFDDERVERYSYQRRGKIPALNETVPRGTGEIVVFSDASSMFAKDSIRKLIRHFADENVGCVAGNQVYTESDEKGATVLCENAYWDYDRFIKVAESNAGSVISATGAIYAIRRELFEPVPPGVTDDFTVSTRVIRKGYRIVFDSEAVASEAVAVKPKSEFKRKVRVMSRGLRAVWEVRDLLNPFKYGFYSWQLFSHKILRRLVVFPLLILMILIPWQWAEGGWLRIISVSQIFFYALAFAGWLFSRLNVSRLPFFSVPFYFVLVNLAALIATKNLFFGKRIDRWDSHRLDAISGNDPTLKTNE